MPNTNILINEVTGQEYDNVPPKVAAEYLGVAHTYIYAGLQQGRLPIGSAIKGEGGRWSYNIPVNRLKIYKNGFDAENLIKLLNILMQTDVKPKGA